MENPPRSYTSNLESEHLMFYITKKVLLKDGALGLGTRVHDWDIGKIITRVRPVGADTTQTFSVGLSNSYVVVVYKAVMSAALL